MIIENPDAGLTFGEIELHDGDVTGPYWFETRSEGLTFGNPEQVFRAVNTMLQDGSAESVDSWGNREMVFPITIVADSALGLELGEQALKFEESKQRNTLTWTPPDKIVGSGTPSVYDIVRAELQFEFDDMNELMLRRGYVLTLHALPWVHAEQVVEVLSEAPPITTALSKFSVNDGSSTSGWSVRTGTYTGAVLSTTGSAIQVKRTRPNGNAYSGWGDEAILSGLSVGMGATPFVRLDAGASVTGTGSIYEYGVEINDVRVTEVARNGSVAWYPMPAGQTTLNKVRVFAVGRLYAYGNTITIVVNDVSRSNLTSDSSAGQRQTFRTFPMQGSVRTPGDLVLWDETAALGTALIYTTPAVAASAQPPLRTRLVSAVDETADPALVSGKFSDLSTVHNFDVPMVNFDPVGAGYLLVARVKHASAGTKAISFSDSSRLANVTLDDAPHSGVCNAALAADTWTMVPVAKLHLPTYTMRQQGFVRVSLSGPAGLLLDEAWLFNTDTGRLTIVECGTGTPTPGVAANRLWLNSASLGNPVPTIQLGTAADGTDSYGAGSRIQSFGRHEFTPPLTNAYVVCSGSIATNVRLSYYPSYAFHVVSPDAA